MPNLGDEQWDTTGMRSRSLRLTTAIDKAAEYCHAPRAEPSLARSGDRDTIKVQSNPPRKHLSRIGLAMQLLPLPFT